MLIVLATVIVGLVSAAGTILYSRGRAATDPYQDALAPIIVEHNSVIDRWNEFLTSYNSLDTGKPSEFDAKAQDGFDLTSRLVVDAQSVIRSWIHVVPPPEMEEAHRLAQDAMLKTQDGFVELSDYFEDILLYGIAFDESVVAGREMLEWAAVLWDQARTAAAQANN